jgi:Flp pilus assembly protein TadD
MLNSAADEVFKKGLTAYRTGDFEGAAALFHRALDLDRRRDARRPDMRYLSFYGLSLARAGLSSQMAVQACRKAVRQQPDSPVLHLNLGRVLMILGRRNDARKAFDEGLRLAPMHESLRNELAPIDRRHKPVIGVLSRSNPLNRALGRMLKKKRAARVVDPRP